MILQNAVEGVCTCLPTYLPTGPIPKKARTSNLGVCNKPPPRLHLGVYDITEKERRKNKNKNKNKNKTKKNCKQPGGVPSYTPFPSFWGVSVGPWMRIVDSPLVST